MTGELGTHHVARLLVLAHLLGYDVARAPQGIVLVLHVPFHKRAHLRFQVILALHQEQRCQRFQSLLACHFGTCLPLGLVRQIDVFQFRSVPARINSRPKFGSEFPQSLYRGEHGFLAFRQLAQLLVACLYLAYLHLVHASRRLFPIAADEGNGGSTFEELQCIFYPMHRQFQCLCNPFAKSFHSICFSFSEGKDRIFFTTDYIFTTDYTD